MKEHNQKTTKTEHKNIGSDKECSKMKGTKTKKIGNTWNCKEKEDKGEENVRIHRKI